ncbi:hypothetical protein MMC31_007024 [Peltigera leucophlebia]|nr:hypothetical protein [Peltigera leucophlebia]
METLSLLDLQETVESYKATINKAQTGKHEIIGKKLANTSDFVTPSERRKYNAAKTIANAKLHLSRAEEFSALGHQNFGKVWVASGLRQAYPPSTPANSLDLALVDTRPTRVYSNYTCPQVNTKPENRKKGKTSSGDERRLDYAMRPIMRRGQLYDRPYMRHDRISNANMQSEMRNMRCGMPQLQLSAPASLRIAVTSIQNVSEYRLPATPGALVKDEKFFIRGRSSGVSMGMYAGETVIVLQSRKLESHGVLRKPITREHSNAPISGHH